MPAAAVFCISNLCSKSKEMNLRSASPSGQLFEAGWAWSSLWPLKVGNPETGQGLPGGWGVSKAGPTHIRLSLGVPKPAGRHCEQVCQCCEPGLPPKESCPVRQASWDRIPLLPFLNHITWDESAQFTTEHFSVAPAMGVGQKCGETAMLEI